MLRDHGDAADFRVLQLGGGECAGASQQKIGTLFFEAAHERNYRDALKYQRKYAEALNCAEAGLQAVARALADATAIPENDDLSAFAEQLGRCRAGGTAVGRRAGHLVRGRGARGRAR